MKRIISILIIAIMSITLFAIPAFADGTNVVTIGQDLSDEQEAFILKYFGVDINTAEVIYVNNQQEREYVGSWIPLEQIGNITISSAYVQPTTSGGIQVKTANLTYVTGNMIASVLSTAGVKNCNIIAAAPFPVSGTGALTGVMIAYQKATGETLKPERRDLAVQEFTVTQQVSQSIGESEALQAVNAIKAEVIKSDVSPDNTIQIQQIVNEVINNIEENTYIDNSNTIIDSSTTIVNNGLTDDDRQMMIDLATEIAKQDIRYEEVKDTLNRVEENLSKETDITILIDNKNDVNIDADSQDTDNINIDNIQENDANSILENTNDSMIDASYQSSTREEDIISIEQEVENSNTEDSGFNDALYDMSNTEEYHEYVGDADISNVSPEFTEIMPTDISNDMQENDNTDSYNMTIVNETFETYQDNDMDVNEDDDIMENLDVTIVDDSNFDEIIQISLENDMEETESVWKYETHDLPDDIQAIFDTVADNTEKSLLPTAYLGSQVVAGMNYKILCIESGDDNGQILKVITIYNDLDDVSTVTNITDFDLDALLNRSENDDINTERLDGGWFVEEPEKCDLPDELLSTFLLPDELFSEGQIDAVNQEIPVNIIGYKSDANKTIYAILCYHTAELENNDGYLFVRFVSVDDTSDAAVIKDIRLDIGALGDE